ncbi:hypothetical protein SLE2022_288360 [Rubroshorea leprosula]
MEGGKAQGVVMVKSVPQQKLIEQLRVKYKELEKGFKTWLAKQSLPVETAVVTAGSAAQGALVGGMLGTLSKDFATLPPPPPPPNLDPQAMVSLKQAQALSGGPLIQARNFALMTGVNAAISTVMKRFRGKEDLETSVVAAFGSGAVFSLASGIGGPNPVTNLLTSGLSFALIQGCIFKLGQTFSPSPAEDMNYVKARFMLYNLGLQKYEKNFKKGILTDNTLPLLTESALRDAKIPPGPRLLILDHVQRNPDLRKQQAI